MFNSRKHIEMNVEMKWNTFSFLVHWNVHSNIEISTLLDAFESGSAALPDPTQIGDALKLVFRISNAVDWEPVPKSKGRAG